MPGCGPIVAAIAAASGRAPDYHIGKPGVMLLEILVSQNGLQPHELLVIGDGPESDIAMANRFGSPSVLICAGDSGKIPDLGEHKPSFVLDSLAELPKMIREHIECVASSD